MELVSVIVPVYNVEAYIDRCISSIAGQTYRNLEIILVDDGSSDRSPALCDAWAGKDSRITAIHQRNGGVSSARNTGLNAASGSFLLQVDSDDYIAPETIEMLVRAANETAADMVICDFLKGNEGDYQFSGAYPERITRISREEALARIFTDDHNALRYAAPWSKLCKRQLYDGICYPDGKIFEDIHTTHNLLYRCNQIAVLDVPLFYYFQRANSIMNTKFNLKKLDYLQALVERVAFFEEHGLDELKQTSYDELLHSLIWEYSRTRDMLGSQEGMTYVKALFRQVYQKGYSSQRYPKENRRFLSAFYRNPERIIRYWRIQGKLNAILKRNG